jgi:hypothetical protein
MREDLIPPLGEAKMHTPNGLRDEMEVDSSSEAAVLSGTYFERSHPEIFNPDNVDFD